MVPLYQGESNHNYSIHTHIWNNVDPDRCGIYPNVMDSNFGFESYAAYILQQPLVVARHGTRIVGVGRKSAFEVYPSFLGHGDIEQILSMFYYDVCLNHNGIELRTADSLAPRYAASYAQLIKTLFSSHAAQEGILRRYAGANSAQIEAAKVGICATATRPRYMAAPPLAKSAGCWPRPKAMPPPRMTAAFWSRWQSWPQKSAPRARFPAAFKPYFSIGSAMYQAIVFAVY